MIELRHRTDLLFGVHPVELWLSEFGFDTNEKSPYKTPRIYKNGQLVADQQDVQAQWLLRGFLEVAAARWDRAMIYDYRDENSITGDLFRSSGLLVDKSLGYTPKKSYYAVATMKNALRGTKFNQEIKVDDDPTFTTDSVYGGHSYWFRDSTYHRILKFTTSNTALPTVAGQVVYATWLPTMSGAVRYNVQIPVPTGATQATLVRVRVGDIDGVCVGE